MWFSDSGGMLSGKAVDMNLLGWTIGLFTGKARSLLRRGRARAKRHNYRGAIDDFTAAVALPTVPNNVKSMVLYERALAYQATGDKLKEARDLNVILAMADAPGKMLSLARRKLAGMECSSRHGKN